MVQVALSILKPVGSAGATAQLAIKADGTITAWGHSLYGGTGAPAGSGYTKISALRAAKAYPVE
jgi:alpha-tubulin suppressor-like RCC1 family protein